MQKDPYRLLGLSRNATLSDLRQAFRRLVRRYHPDVNPDPRALKEFQAILEAYQYLKEHLREPPPGAGAITVHFLEISFREAVLGASKEILILGSEVTCSTCEGTGEDPGGRQLSCPECQGQGVIKHQWREEEIGIVCATCRGRGFIIESPCPQCQGQGRFRPRQAVNIAIPPGTEDGTIIDKTLENGERLQVEISVRPDPVFSRRGLDIIARVRIPLWQALLGGRLTIPTLTGQREIELPPPPELSRPLKFPGEGIMASKKRGDFLVFFEILLPERPSDEARDLIERLAQILPVKDSKSHP
ncbi:DnaJ C-terminal domain-containing protein [Thermosulfuriphilus sp.]